MRVRYLSLLSALVLPACIDFVAVEDVGDDPRGQIVFQSEHADRAEATLQVRLPRLVAPSPIVMLDGILLQASEDGDFWRYRATPSVDTLRPRFELEIQTDRVLALSLPFVTRNGPPVWRPDGDLELPMTYDGPSSDSELTWRVLVDMDGVVSLGINSHGAPLPNPIVIPAALVPAGATTAVFTAELHQQTHDLGFPVAVSISSGVRALIPEGV